MRLVDADALKEFIGKVRAKYDFFTDEERPRYEAHSKALELLNIYLDYEPTIDAVEVVRGEWIDEANECDASFGIHDYICSNCNHHADDHIGGHMWYTMYKPNYCQYCGARMKGADDE